MEFTFFSLLCVLLGFIFLLHKLSSKRKDRVMKLPPGPKQLPVIGNLHQLPGGLMHHGLRDMAKKHGPLMYLKLGETSTIVVSSPEMAKEIYRTHDIIFSQRPTNSIAFKIFSYDFIDIIFSPYGNYWKNLRRICISELLNQKRVKSFQSIREEEVLKMIKSISSSSSLSSSSSSSSHVINLSKKIYELIFAITSRAAFGKRIQSVEKFEKLTAEASRLAAIFDIPDLYPSLKFLQMFSRVKPQMEIAVSQADEILEDILNEHKQKMVKSSSSSSDEKDDIVDVLLRIQKNDENSEVPLADTNLKAVIFDIFAAGSETSSSTVEWAISETLRNPRILNRAQEEVRSRFSDKGNVEESNLDDLKYLQAIVKETHRFHPSAPLSVPRENKEQCTINGYNIPPNTRVLINAWAIGRDSNSWTDEPEVFKPERFLDSEIDLKGNHFQYIPFGGGRRICPGINFAEPSILLSLAQLLFHFDWKLPGDRKLEELDVEEKMAVTVRRKNDLKLIPVPYRGSSLII